MATVSQLQVQYLMTSHNSSCIEYLTLLHSSASLTQKNLAPLAGFLWLLIIWWGLTLLVHCVRYQRSCVKFLWTCCMHITSLW